MKSLLRIDASIRSTDSVTRSLADHFEHTWKLANPGGGVIHHCLAQNPPPHLSPETLSAFDAPYRHPQIAAWLADWEKADEIVIASPLYNLGAPSSLKAYFDHIVISGISFEYAEGQYRGLFHNRPATLITARGGAATPGIADDYLQGWLAGILQFIGITDNRFIALDGTSVADPVLEEALINAKARIRKLCMPESQRVWVGHFSKDDQDAIAALSYDQARSIIEGSVETYANLCAEDIQLLLPGYALVRGKAAFINFEKQIFAKTKFHSFRKYPLLVERSGDIAIETGEQEISTCQNAVQSGIFSSHQKYTHIFRKTVAGWRFATLMSNPS